MRKTLCVLGALMLAASASSAAADEGPQKKYVDWGWCASPCLINCPCVELNPIIVT